MRFIPVLFLSGIVLIACGSKKTPQDYKNIIDYNVEQLNEERETGQVDKATLLSAGDAYYNYILRFPDDSANIPHYFYEAIQHYTEGGKYQTGIALIDTFRIRHPSHTLSPALLHFKAYYIYELGLQDIEMARITYESFINLYPENEELLETVLFSLEHLGKSNEEVLDEILEKAGNDTLNGNGQ